MPTVRFAEPKHGEVKIKPKPHDSVQPRPDHTGKKAPVTLVKQIPDSGKSNSRTTAEYGKEANKTAFAAQRSDVAPLTKPALPAVPYPKKQVSVDTKSSKSAPLKLRSMNQSKRPEYVARWLNQSSAICDRLTDRMTAVLESVDGDIEEEELPQEQNLALLEWPDPTLPIQPEGAVRTPTIIRPNNGFSSSYFAKSWLYSNSVLPRDLPPLKVYTPTYPILCLAARHCYLSYTRPMPSSPPQKAYVQQPVLVPASVRMGTKAMMLCIVPSDDKEHLVLAIRGSSNVFDWAVNFDSAPSSPDGFLDCAENGVHAGFLAVAKSMICPVADSLRALIEDRHKTKQRLSLILTGHSAGGAVASLLYCHMLSQSPSVSSELKDLAESFHRIHCCTFGAPPLSLLPMGKPPDPDGNVPLRWKKSLFFSFINEGDPVARADKVMLRNLLLLYVSPAPVTVAGSVNGGIRKVAWNVPSISLSNAGRIVVLRTESKTPKKRNNATSPGLKPARKGLGMGAFLARRRANGLDNPGPSADAQTDSPSANADVLPETHNIEAVEVTDEHLRDVVWGDPRFHAVAIYESRVKYLAIKNVTGGVYE